ncbi:imidazole glycerol phosphate synthase subunit HisH [Scatolibacter rhodanostii]|uniref:imidazole glycerol phosphate synthase subunit HisH n=1 Tax=Scatolibacter rhodanostii TaxID=2014781 RepID=UPI000C081BE3|nr:imidazole glycerol phosphate synthase subunit HisH [Scatolibacter rhodanostii]
MVTVIDYGAGNIQSVMNALRFIGCEAVLADDPKALKNSKAVLLPGVGSFGDAMANLKKRGFATAIQEWTAADKPFLGICLGMQVLFESSEESPGIEGLGILKGKFKKFPANLGVKVPHIGWNSLDVKNDSGIFDGLPENPYVYFVHSYYLQAEEPIVSARADYGIPFDAAVQKGNLWACQFHPEKSGETGIAMLKNFSAAMNREG